MREAGGYILLESLVGLVVFAALAVTTATVARRAFQAGADPSPSVDAVLERMDPPVRTGREVQRVGRREFPNGDRWSIYRYQPGGGRDAVLVPVFRPDAGGTTPAVGR